MKRYICTIVIASYFLTFISPNVLFCQSSDIRITKIQGDKFAINKGKNDLIMQDSVYLVFRNNKKIGKAKVVAVRENVSALEIINSKVPIQIGDYLAFDSEDESTSILEDLSTSSNKFSKDKLTENPNYILEGQNAAQNDYGGSGAMIGGLASGLFFGLLGWLIGYLIVSGSEVSVPLQYLSALQSQQQFEFSMGYKDQVKKKRNSSFHAGAAIGTLILVLIVTSASSE